MTAPDPRIEAAAQQLEKQGFLGWLLSNGDSLLWTRISPEWEMARVTLVAADAVDPLRQPGMVVVNTNDEVTVELIARALAKHQQWIWEEIQQYAMGSPVVSQARAVLAALREEATP